MFRESESNEAITRENNDFGEAAISAESKGIQKVSETPYGLDHRRKKETLKPKPSLRKGRSERYAFADEATSQINNKLCRINIKTY